MRLWFARVAGGSPLRPPAPTYGRLVDELDCSCRSARRCFLALVAGCALAQVQRPAVPPHLPTKKPRRDSGRRHAERSSAARQLVEVFGDPQLNQLESLGARRQSEPEAGSAVPQARGWCAEHAGYTHRHGPGTITIPHARDLSGINRGPVTASLHGGLPGSPIFGPRPLSGKRHRQCQASAADLQNMRLSLHPSCGWILPVAGLDMEENCLATRWRPTKGGS